jgi:L-ascorbate metabolism protein UlaG (beta-lactamase superfamily)
MEIEYVTHASLLLRGRAVNLLTDPFYFLDDFLRPIMCLFPPRTLTDSTFTDLHYVFSSHIHPDHSHPHTLLRLRNQIGTVLLPGDRPTLEQRYRALGFSKIIVLRNGVSTPLAGDIRVTCFWDSPVDSVLIIESDGIVVLHQNDCCLAAGTLEQIEQRFRIDYAFMNYTWSQNLYPLLLPRPDAELERLSAEKESGFLTYQTKVVDILRPKVVVPYSMTMTYFQPDQLHLNGYGRMTPPVFGRELRKARPQQRVLVVQPGDIINTATGAVVASSGGSSWGSDVDEFLANIAAYARRHANELPGFQNGDPAASKDALIRHFEAHRSVPYVEFLRNQSVHLCVVGDASERRYLVDLARGAVFTIARDDTRDVPSPILGTVNKGGRL